jgi:thymidylate synthase (FAD)
MTTYKPSRDGNDYMRRDPQHADSRRRSNDHGPASPSANGIIQIGTDGLEVALIQDYDDDVYVTVSKYAQSASRGAHPDVIAAEVPGEFIQGGLAFQSLEDIRIAFGVRGASRVLTHQLVRTRQAAFKQQSQRDCWYGEMPEFRMPESVWMNPDLRAPWVEALYLAHEAYNLAVEADIPYEDARYIMPEGTTNFIFCEYSLKTFMETYAYRGCVMFQDEMYTVFRAMRDLIIASHPYLSQHLLISCEKIQRCTFQGSERTDRTCDLPWARGEAKAIPLSQVRG